MEFQAVIEKLQVELMHPLPGESAHRVLAPVKRLSTAEYLQQFPSYKTGCVAVILFPDGDSTRLLLIERADNSAVHSGQISFPGGKREMDDATLLDTAMREMYEEVGISPSTINILGQLSELYIPVSNFLVHPFVGYSNIVPQIIMNEMEVKNVIFPALGEMLNMELQMDKFESKSFGFIEAPYYPFGEYRIWGATAMVISELIYILKR